MALKKVPHGIEGKGNTKNNDTDIHSPSSPKARPANIVSYCSWGFSLKDSTITAGKFPLNQSPSLVLPHREPLSMDLSPLL